MKLTFNQLIRIRTIKFLVPVENIEILNKRQDNFRDKRTRHIRYNATFLVSILAYSKNRIYVICPFCNFIESFTMKNLQKMKNGVRCSRSKTNRYFIGFGNLDKSEEVIT
jgi:hypothetical protein